MKKSFFLASILLTGLCLVACGPSNSSTQSETSQTTDSEPIKEEKEYRYIFTADENFSYDIKTTYAEVSKNFASGSYSKFEATAHDRNDSATFIIKSGFLNPDGYLGFAYNGTFGNFYSKLDKDHNAINGIKSLTVNFSVDPSISNKMPARLGVNYSYEEFMDKGQYAVNSQLISSGVPYTFDNNYPQYFQICLNDNVPILIKDIELVYTASQEKQRLPEKHIYDSGYQVGAIKGRDTLETAYEFTATNGTEAYHALEYAAINHYQYAIIHHNYLINETYEEFSNLRRGMTYVYFQPLDPFEKVENSTITYLLVYLGTTDVNNDTLGEEGEVQDGEVGYMSHFQIASYFSTGRVQYFPQVINGNAALRNAYAKANNLCRESTYNDFPIEKLPDERYMDVRNSEELWWAAANNYKPRFVLENSKAEWMYNEAKAILNSIMYKGMSKFEQLRAIYEWIVGNVKYDYDALQIGRSIEQQTCFYLEGVFERRRAVCDGLSKMFILLAKIEGLDVIRGNGFTKEWAGHAWVYARTNESEPYYLICPTWGSDQMDLSKTSDKVIGYDYLRYESFMTSKNYFKDKRNYVFNDLNSVGLNLSDSIYSFVGNEENATPKSIYNLDYLPGHPEIDYEISNMDELLTIVKETKKICKDTFAISFTSKTPIEKPLFQQLFANPDIKEEGYFGRMYYEKLYGVINYTIYYVSEAQNATLPSYK